MKIFLRILLGITISISGAYPLGVLHADEGSTLFKLSVPSIEGENVDLSEFEGQVLLIVNTASKCGFTSQYGDLQKLYEKYHAQGFTVLGFPSNDFAEQEPGSDEQIREFCRTRYGVTFPMFCRSEVSGENKNPVFQFLTEESGNDFSGEIEWNFEKFLVDQHGIVRARFGSFTNPMSTSVVSKIEELLSPKADEK